MSEMDSTLLADSDNKWQPVVVVIIITVTSKKKGSIQIASSS